MKEIRFRGPLPGTEVGSRSVAGAWIALLLMMVAPNAALSEEFPAPPLTRALKAKMTAADEAFEDERFPDAYRIYKSDLAPMGDKYSQYKIGLMHLHGLGVPRSFAAGVAWFELAAERDHARLSEVRDKAATWLSTDDRLEVEALLVELRAEYGDCAVAGRLLADDRKLEPAVGTRVTSSHQPVTVIHGDMRGIKNVNAIRERIRDRERFLRENCR